MVSDETRGEIAKRAGNGMVKIDHRSIKSLGLADWVGQCVLYGALGSKTAHEGRGIVRYSLALGRHILQAGLGVKVPSEPVREG